MNVEHEDIQDVSIYCVWLKTKGKGFQEGKEWALLYYFGQMTS